jgi:uncharacterized membrane protein
MKRVKKIDFEINAALIVLSVVFAFLAKGAAFLVGYFVVGTWQIISITIHYYKGWFCDKGTKRRNYQTTVIIVLISVVMGFIIKPILVVIAFTLLFLAPAMAVYYAIICYEETYLQMRRPLYFLK